MKDSKFTLMCKLGVAVSFFLLLNTTVSAQEYKKITRMGTSQAVCHGGIETLAELQAYFAENPDNIRAILANSGWTGSANDLLAAVANGDVAEIGYAKGTKLASLVAVSPDNSVACNPPAPAPVAESAPQPEPEPEANPLALIPFIGVFAGSETRPRLETEWQMDMKDSSGIVGLRAGLIKEISAKTAVFGQISYYDRQGINDFNVYPEDNFAIDIGVERKLSEKAFIGGGIGAWNVDDSDFRDTSLFGHVGGGIGKSNLQWFLEGRVFDTDSELDSISDNKMFSAGVRYLVK